MKQFLFIFVSQQLIYSIGSVSGLCEDLCATEDNVRVECNQCQCSNGSIAACTLKLCLDQVQCIPGQVWIQGCDDCCCDDNGQRVCTMRPCLDTVCVRECSQSVGDDDDHSTCQQDKHTEQGQTVEETLHDKEIQDQHGGNVEVKGKQLGQVEEEDPVKDSGGSCHQQESELSDNENNKKERSQDKPSRCIEFSPKNQEDKIWEANTHPHLTKASNKKARAPYSRLLRKKKAKFLQKYGSKFQKYPSQRKADIL